MVMGLEWNRLPVSRRCFSPLHSNTLIRSSCHHGYTRNKDGSSTAAKTGIALCALGSVISMGVSWTEYLGGCGFISQVEYAKLRTWMCEHGKVWTLLLLVPRLQEHWATYYDRLALFIAFTHIITPPPPLSFFSLGMILWIFSMWRELGHHDYINVGSWHEGLLRHQWL